MLATPPLSLVSTSLSAKFYEFNGAQPHLSTLSLGGARPHFSSLSLVGAQPHFSPLSLVGTQPHFSTAQPCAV